MHSQAAGNPSSKPPMPLKTLMYLIPPKTTSENPARLVRGISDFCRGDCSGRKLNLLAGPGTAAGEFAISWAEFDAYEAPAQPLRGRTRSSGAAKCIQYDIPDISAL